MLSGLCPPQEIICAKILSPLILKKVKPFSSLVLYIESHFKYSGFSAVIPLAKEGHPALELPIGPTKNVFTSSLSSISPD